jgi:hypothetical protein
MHDIIVVEQEDQQQHHLYMMNPTRIVIIIAESLVEKENPFSLCDGYQNLQHSTT